MSTPVDNSLTNLKASTGQIMAIISTARQIPPGPSHLALGKQVATLVADVVKEYGSRDGPLPGLIILCSKELLHIWNMVPKVWPDWYSIGKGKAVFPDLEPEAEWSKKKKSPLISGLSSQPPKSAMKSHKRQRSAHLVKSKPIVELEDDEDSVVQPLLHRMPEVILPRLSTIVARTPNSPHSPRAPTKKPFGPARVIAGSHPAVMEPSQPSQPTPKPPVQALPVMPVVDILIPGPVKQPMLHLPQAQLSLRNSVGQEDQGSVYVMHLLHDKEDQVHPHLLVAPSKNPSKAPPRPKPPAPPQLPMPPNPRPELATQTHGRSKTITAIKPPAPAPASLLSSRSAVPAAALGVPMLDLHAMSHAIQDAAARIALLEAHVAEQDDKIDTLQHFHEGLRHKIIDWHPSFPLPDTPANATSLLLDQSGP
ncbi:hypothetical protein BDR03DRAFT_1011510 [Suillus americanus]|nr:hypothetical protein BDR03DRAFT_1011510 [Suillus americanus]